MMKGKEWFKISKNKLCILLTSVLLKGGLFAQTPLERSEIISIGGIKQYIYIKGKDNSKPLLLFLHGGPGGSVMNYANKFTNKLQEHFIVVQWDQRETGKTKELNTTQTALTATLFENDTHTLIDSLLRRFNRQKIFLVAHSWGTYLGFQVSKKHPEWLYAYVAISPMVYQAESERIVLGLMKQKAMQSAGKRQLEELSTIEIPFKDGEDLYLHRKWLFDFIGTNSKVSRNFVTGWATTWLQVFNEASTENFMETLPSVNCPIYFCVGRRDFQTNFTLVEKYYKQLAAPKKGLFWFERAAHSIPSAEPERLQNVIIDIILKETYIE